MRSQLKQKTIVIALLVVSILLQGCDTIRNTFGLDHTSPDAWSTEPHPGLVIPPGLHERQPLPVPQPGASNPNMVTPEAKAQKTVLGSTISPTAPSGRGEKDILNQVSQDQPTTPNIRNLVDEEAQADGTVSGTIISKIKSWKKEATENLTNTQSKSSQTKESPSE